MQISVSYSHVYPIIVTNTRSPTTFSPVALEGKHKPRVLPHTLNCRNNYFHFFQNPPGRDYAKEQLFTWLWFCLFPLLAVHISSGICRMSSSQHQPENNFFKHPLKFRTFSVLLCTILPSYVERRHTLDSGRQRGYNVLPASYTPTPKCSAARTTLKICGRWISPYP